MKQKAKGRRRRDGQPPDINEAVVEPCSASATPGRSSIERVDEHKTGSVESVRQTGPESSAAVFMEPEVGPAQG